MKVMGIRSCSTYKKALKWFDENNISYETVDLRKNPLTKEEIALYHQYSGNDIAKFFNTSGKMYRELNMKEKRKTLSNNELYQYLSDYPMLIKRPLIVDNEYVRTGFNEEEYTKHWL